jgi:hypothetical protein
VRRITALGNGGAEVLTLEDCSAADVDRFGEFLDAYCSATLPDEQRASLMEMLIQCVEEMDEPSKFASSWSAIEPLLITRAGLHRPSIAYWAKLGEIDPVAKFRVSPAMRRVWTAISG